MLGNFSFGDYFKKEAVEWAWEFLTRELGLPEERLWITIFEGDENAPEDLEAKELWMSVGVPEERIFGLPKSENWWGPPGDSGPCGPCSEIYYDYGEEFAKGDPLSDPRYGPGGDEGDPRFLEIWNLVFNQYEQRKDGTLTPLAKTGIDTGLGLERTTQAVQHAIYIYDTDVYAPIFEKIREYSGVELGANEEVCELRSRCCDRHLLSSQGASVGRHGLSNGTRWAAVPVSRRQERHVSHSSGRGLGPERGSRPRCPV